MRPALRAEHGLLIGYLGGVAGTTWDWHEHYVGVSNQAPHLPIDLSALLVVGVLGFSHWNRYSRTARITIYYLLVAIALIALAPYALMLTTPHSQLMANLMSWEMTRGALLLEGPFVGLAAWVAWRWAELSRVTVLRVVAAGGVVVVAAASVWDLYWHQTHPMELGASMNMMTLPPHQLILAGFIAGLIASAGVLVAKSRLPEPATTRA